MERLVWSERISFEITAVWSGITMLKRLLISLLAIFALTFGFVGTAGAEDDEACESSTAVDGCDGDDVDVQVPDEDEEEDASGVDVKPKTLDPSTDVQGRQQLPVTGAESVTLALGGAVLVAAGGLMVRRSTKTA